MAIKINETVSVPFSVFAIDIHTKDKFPFGPMIGLWYLFKNTEGPGTKDDDYIYLCPDYPEMGIGLSFVKSIANECDLESVSENKFSEDTVRTMFLKSDPLRTYFLAW